MFQEKFSVLDFVDKENIEDILPIKPLSIECTPFKLVEEVKGLKELAATLSTVNEFAVYHKCCSLYFTIKLPSFVLLGSFFLWLHYTFLLKLVYYSLAAPCYNNKLLSIICAAAMVHKL